MGLGGMSGLAKASDVVGRVRDLGEQESKAMEERFEILRRLMRGSGHDLNNHLAAILTNTELSLIELPASSPAREYVEAIQQATREAYILCSQIMAYVGKGEGGKEPTDALQLISGMDRLIHSLLPRGIQFVTHLAGNTAPASVDPGQLRQLVIALIAIAIESLAGRGLVQLSLRSHAGGAASPSTSLPEGIPDPCLLIEVSASEDDADSVESRRRGAPSSCEGSAGRIGMAVARTIVKAHRGVLLVWEEPIGITVVVCLPML